MRFFCLYRLAHITAQGKTFSRTLGIGSSIHFVSEPGRGRMTKLLSASDNFDAGARRDYATRKPSLSRLALLP